MKIYLAGPIGGLSYQEATNGWREEVKDLFNDDKFEIFSPMRFKDILKDELILDQKEYNHPLVTSEAIFKRDRNDVLTSDLIFVNFIGSTKISIGTCVELGWADAFNKPIVIVTDNENPHIGPFIQTITPFKARTLSEGVQMVKYILCKG